ncbi:MAG: hypothetical protein M0Z99_36735 [Betaproteobacteria bacterium]|nr:hypothetical protein [Betaproteobacteria bacterium]
MNAKTNRPKNTMPAGAVARVSRSSAAGQFISGDRTMTPTQLHRAMVSYGKEVAADHKSAMAFLKRIGAPLKTAKR